MNPENNIIIPFSFQKTVLSLVGCTVIKSSGLMIYANTLISKPVPSVLNSNFIPIPNEVNSNILT